VIQELSRPGGADRGSDRAVQAVFVNDQGDAFAFEKYLCKSGAVIAGKASAADGLNLANSMVRVMNTIALGYGNMRSPYSDGCRDCKKNILETVSYTIFAQIANRPGQCSLPLNKAQNRQLEIYAVV
jgi:hypothetical protein